MTDGYNLQEINSLDQVIQNPARLMLVYLLERYDQMDYVDLMARTGLTSGNITTHIARLESSKYISIKKSFRGKKPHTTIELTPRGREAYHRWGEAILCALPMSVKPRLRARLMQSEIMYEYEKSLLASTIIDAWRDMSILPQQFNNRHSMPPMLMLQQL